MLPIKFYSKKRIPLDGGDIFHFIKSNDENYKSFGEVYFSLVKFNAIKGWKKHNKMTMNLTCIEGKIEFIFAYKNNTYEWDYLNWVLTPENHGVLCVPPNYYFSFRGLGNKTNILANFSDIIHDESEISRLSLDSIPYLW